MVATGRDEVWEPICWRLYGKGVVQRLSPAIATSYFDLFVRRRR